MKTALLSFCLLFLLWVSLAEAQPPPPPGWHGGDNNESPSQEDGFLGNGLGILLFMGVAYATAKWSGHGHKLDKPGGINTS